MNEQIVTVNRAASHNYELYERYEAGIALKGYEVKSIRQGSINIRDGYVIIKNNEVFLVGAHISPYSHLTSERYDPLRTRKLLLKRSEIDKLTVKVKEKGFTLIPTRVYFKKRIAKLEFAVAKGKKLFDKREQIKKREVEKQIRRSFK
ncbi:MAG: SsrA-binding protein SmpB [Deltaproteobacteria bacterium]|nr:SsrA-binding protein SmpB [Deltaproteobacteria bacterium]MCL5792526.1 SsrA-binding protein SmpB [Deltaproteobacteria bacterium]